MLSRRASGLVGHSRHLMGIGGKNTQAVNYSINYVLFWLQEGLSSVSGAVHCFTRGVGGLAHGGVGWLIEGLESGVDWDSIRSLRMGALTQVVGQGDQYQMGETRVARDDEGHTVVSSMEFETSLFLEGATVKAD
ncbi:hypothetical protein Tco_1570045 [Tanacetum coccineum]